MDQKPSFVVPALIGGVFLGVTSALPLVNLINCACCGLVMGGGFLAGYLYLRDYPVSAPPVHYGDGLVLGLLTGVFGGFVWTIVDLPLTIFKFHLGRGMADLRKLEEALSDPNIPPAFREFFLDLVQNGGITLGTALFSFFLYLLIAVVFAAIGAVIAVALFQKPYHRQQSAVGAPRQPGPPPSVPPL